MTSQYRTRCERCGKPFPKKKLTFADKLWRCERCANNVHNKVRRSGNVAARARGRLTRVRAD